MSTNVSAFVANLGKLAGRSDKLVNSALLEGAQLVLTDSDARVPFRDGYLQNSGRVSVDAANHRAAISYDMPYAVRQHEDQTLRHRNGREAKYLERAIDAKAADLRALFARRLGGGLL